MSYSDTYRNAMEKVTVSDAWKTDTLNKIASLESQPTSHRSQGRTIRFAPLKKIALPLTAAAAVAIIAVSTLHQSSVDVAGISADAAPQAAAYSADGMSPKARAVTPQTRGALSATPDEASAVPNILPQTVTADSALQALPQGTTDVDPNVVSDEQYAQAVAQLDALLSTQGQDGTLPVLLTANDILASGCLLADGKANIVFVLPATTVSDQSYYVYQIPVV